MAWFQSTEQLKDSNALSRTEAYLARTETKIPLTKPADQATLRAMVAQEASMHPEGIHQAIDLGLTDAQKDELVQLSTA